MEHDLRKYMQQCLVLAEIALKNGNPPVGAIVVFEDTIIGKGIESGKSSGDITNHAEILAIRDAIKNGHSNNLNQAKLFSTHEPCIMCSYLIRHHKLPHIIYGSAVPFIGGATSAFNILSTEDIPKWGKKPTITEGICKTECNALTGGFATVIEKTDNITTQKQC
jgi:tRNA(adenine34) deaminase